MADKAEAFNVSRWSCLSFAAPPKHSGQIAFGERAPGRLDQGGTMVGFVRVISEMRLRVRTQKNLLRHDIAEAQSFPDVLA